MAPNNPSDDVNQVEISLLDIVNFLQESWKKLVISAIIGAVLGFGYWYVLGSYQAELVILNNGGTDLVGLRSMQKSLPNLAQQIIDESKSPQGQESLYRTLSNSEWWQKNLTPTYVLSKADIKDLASISGFESAGSSIVSLTMTAVGSSKEEAIENVLGTKNFLLQGAAYLAVKSLISSQEVQLVENDANVDKKINATKIELGYQQERLKSLESLAKRFPNEQKILGQIVDPKDSSAKYLPIGTQIIAANADLNTSKEALERLKDIKAQSVFIRTWLKQAVPLAESSYDGLTLIRQLLEQEAQLRSTLGANDPQSQFLVDSLRSSLLGLNVRFTKGFEIKTAPTSSGKKGMMKSIACGFALGLFLMLLVLLCQKVWVSANSGAIK